MAMAVREPEDGEAETVTRRDADGDENAILALYVSGPFGAKRHLLWPGVIRLGRSSESAIVIDDPRVSRVHAALEVADQVRLSDLGSANGTYLDHDRLSAGEVRVLVPGNTFFLGDSAVVVRPSSLHHERNRCFSSLELLQKHLEQVRAAPSVDQPLALLRVRGSGQQSLSLLAAVLGESLRSPSDWILRSGRHELFLGLEVSSAAEAARLEREALQRLFGWSLGADAEWRLCSWREAHEDLATALNSFDRHPPVTLQQGSVVILDPAMRAIHACIARVAPAPVNVLVLGETGSGKDVAASMVHELSQRHARAFVCLNCASLPEQLLESELFGHERGAFTGAVAAKVGLLELADGGTVFLDEIGDLPFALQAKLLRVIESGEVQRVGGVHPRRVDVRFVSATNHDLARDVEAGRFRRDLYYRLNCVTLQLPPLRERPSEIEALTHLFLERACARFELPARSLSRAALAALAAHPFPGNVRELRNIIERAVLLAAGPVIDVHDLELPRSEPSLERERVNSDSRSTSVPEATSERDRIQAALLACGGNQSRAAKMIGIARRTLVRRVASLGLPRPRSSED
jgi:two-component system, NtrC family, response regulator AtoC